MNTIKCWHCGTENPINRKYCDSCGRDLMGKENPPVQPPSLPPPPKPDPPIEKSYKIAVIVLTLIIVVQVIILMILRNNNSSASLLKPSREEPVYVQNTQSEEIAHEDEMFPLCVAG